MLHGFEVLLVTSKTMGAELKEHYALIFLIFYFFSPSEKRILIFISLVQSSTFFVIHVSMGFH